MNVLRAVGVVAILAGVCLAGGVESETQQRLAAQSVIEAWRDLPDGLRTQVLFEIQASFLPGSSYNDPAPVVYTNAKAAVFTAVGREFEIRRVPPDGWGWKAGADTNCIPCLETVKQGFTAETGVVVIVDVPTNCVPCIEKWLASGLERSRSKREARFVVGYEFLSNPAATDGEDLFEKGSIVYQVDYMWEPSDEWRVNFFAGLKETLTLSATNALPKPETSPSLETLKKVDALYLGTDVAWSFVTGEYSAVYAILSPSVMITDDEDSKAEFEGEAKIAFDLSTAPEGTTRGDFMRAEIGYQHAERLDNKDRFLGRLVYGHDLDSAGLKGMLQFSLETSIAGDDDAEARFTVAYAQQIGQLVDGLSGVFKKGKDSEK